MLMKNVYLFQPQYTTIVRGKLNGWLPYSVGTIWSYAQQFKDITDTFTLKEIIFKRENPQDILDRLDNPAVCGFSCYLWNKSYCLHVAELVKQKFPECVIVFGGPDVSGALTSYKFIDTFSNGEGEENFTELLRCIINNTEIPLFFNKKRLEDLDIPSPYTTGVFDNIVKENPDIVWAVTLETNRGCPYKCTFCDWGSMTYSKVKKFNLEKIAEELEWVKRNPISYLYVSDANFGMFKERDLEIARMLKDAADQSTVDLISVQSAKQSTEVVFQIGKVLGDKYAGVDIAMQSMHDATLDAIKRKNLDTNNIQRLMELSEQYNVPTYTEMILGLPLETKESWATGLTQLLELGQHNSIEIWITQMLQNSELNNQESRKKYGIKTVMVKDYITLKSSADFTEIPELTELVCETSTMSTEDMVDSYMYGWMIIQMHITGYSQMIAKYLRKKHNISYKEFYDTLFECIKNSELLKEHYLNLRRNVKNFLTVGTTDEGIPCHMIHSTSAGYFYEIKDSLINFIADCASSIVKVPSNVRELQHKFIFDKTHSYPETVVVDSESYTLNSRMPEGLENQPTIALVRRRGLLKNSVMVSPPGIEPESYS